MTKIKSFKNARELVNKMIENPSLQIQLWNEMNSNRIISVERDAEYDLWCFVTRIDTINGTEERRHVYIDDVAQSIWDNRKNVNKLNDLASL